MLSIVNYGVPVLDKEVKKILDQVDAETTEYLEKNGYEDPTIMKAVGVAQKIKDGVFWAYYDKLPHEQGKIEVFYLNYEVDKKDLVVNVKIETPDYEETITKRYKNAFKEDTK